MSTKRQQQKALRFLASAQQADGGFISFSSPSIEPFRNTVQYETTFFPSLILSTLIGDERQQAQRIVAKLVTFLRQQAGPDLSYNYWSRSSDAFSKLPYPDDLDDTFCALTALHAYDPSFFDGATTAKVAHLLIDREVAPGGPYRTGFVGDELDSPWQRVDIIVNANVAAFLLRNDIVLEPVSKLLKDLILAGTITTPYYADACSSAYLLARTRLDDDATVALRAILLAEQHKDGSWGTPLRTALALTALLRLGYDAHNLRAAFNNLVTTQADDGSWPAAAFSVDPSINGKTHYAGAAAFTTAICYEALMRYESVLARPIAAQKKAVLRVDGHTRDVQAALQTTIKTIEQPGLKQSVTELLQAMVGRSKDARIIGLPWLVADSFHAKTDPRTLLQLSQANLWGWMSYTAFDDVWDGDAEPLLLPSALFCNRQLVLTLQSVLPDLPGFHDEVKRLLTRIDAANDWELRYCRGITEDDSFSIAAIPNYGNYWQLADRSIGHAIAALGVLYAQGLAAESLATKGVRAFFEHYLIARQLLDEVHDWHADLLAGHINAVAALLLNNLYGTTLWEGTLSLKNGIPTLQSLLWTDMIAEVCALIGYHVQRANESLGSVTEFDTAPLLSLLAPLENITHRTLAEREESLAFLHAF